MKQCFETKKIYFDVIIKLKVKVKLPGLKSESCNKIKVKMYQIIEGIKTAQGPTHY